MCDCVFVFVQSDESAQLSVLREELRKKEVVRFT